MKNISRANNLNILHEYPSSAHQSLEKFNNFFP